MSDVVTIISTVGFPIAACVFMGWYVKYINDMHKVEIDKLSEALNNNTIALQRLVDKLGDD